jgi:hypothetical protein
MKMPNPEYIATFNNILLGVIMAGLTAMVTVIGLVISVMNSARKAELAVLEATIERLKKEVAEDDEQDDHDTKTRQELINSYETRLKNCNDALSLVSANVSSMRTGDKPPDPDSPASSQ